MFSRFIHIIAYIKISFCFMAKKNIFIFYFWNLCVHQHCSNNWMLKYLKNILLVKTLPLNPINHHSISYGHIYPYDLVNSVLLCGFVQNRLSLCSPPPWMHAIWNSHMLGNSFQKCCCFLTKFTENGIVFSFNKRLFYCHYILGTNRWKIF